jgi:hypothetical protein
MMKQYWVLQYRSYPDEVGSYTLTTGRAETESQLIDYGWLENTAIMVYDEDRRPWDEVDPYPDWVVSRGPRGGIRWETY